MIKTQHSRQVWRRRRSTFRLMFWFAVIQVSHSGGTIRYPHPHVNHNDELNYSCLYILFMTVFSHASWKFAKAGLLADTELPKHFIETGLLLSFTQAGKAVGCACSADKPYHLYIASIMLRSWIFFICKTFTVIWEKRLSRPALNAITICGDFE